MKVVLDTNVLVSGIFWRGNEAKVVKKCQLRELENCISKEILEEFVRVISYPKFGHPEEEIRAAAEMITAFSTTVKPRRTFEIIKQDKEDNKFLECAYEANARYIISGDEHLLALGSFKNIRIMNAKEFLSAVKF
jgi:putative PIN family toxin of toxin-antitoxin system